MGMTIDKAIPKIQFVRNALNDDMEIAKAYDMAIDIMRKYQKIEEIVNNAKGSDGAVKYNWLYEQIKEVVEDGNNK